MKIKTLIILIFIGVFSFCCSKTIVDKSIDCDKLEKEISKLQLDYVLLNDTTYLRLDSALLLIDTMLCNCEKYYTGLITSKLKILGIKKQYKEALILINELDENKIFPLKKNVLKNRFMAMQAQYSGNFSEKNRLINENFLIYKQIFYNNKNEIIKTLQSEDYEYILSNKYVFDILGYFYYKSQLFEYNDIIVEIDNLQKEINGNIIFFDDFLKEWINTPDFFNTSFEFSKEENFMYFNGL